MERTVYPASGGNISGKGLLIAYEQTARGLKVTDPTGAHYDARFDGREYPVSGTTTDDKIILRRIGARVIEETDKTAGKVTGTSRMTVLQNGKTMTVENHDPRLGSSTIILRKQ